MSDDIAAPGGMRLQAEGLITALRDFLAETEGELAELVDDQRRDPLGDGSERQAELHAQAVRAMVEHRRNLESLLESLVAGDGADGAR